MRSKSVLWLIVAALMVVGLVVSACGPAPTPQVIEKIVQQTVVVEKEKVVTKEVVKEVQKEVTKVVEKTVEVAKVRPKLTMWVDHPWYIKAAEEVLKSQALQWGQKAGVDVEYVQDSDKVMWPKIDAAIESKTLPDVILLNISWMPKFQRAALVTDLTALVAELNKNMDGFAAGPLAAVTTKDGKQFAVPMHASTEMSYVRQDLLDAKKIAFPKTYEEKIAAAKAINNPPTIWGWGPQVTTYDGERHRTAVMWAYGGSVWAKDGETIAIDSDGTRKMLAMIKDLYDSNVTPKDIVTWDDAGNNAAYQTGKVAMIENTGSVAQWMKDNDQDLFKKTTFSAFPAGPAGAFVPGDAWVLIVPTTTKNPDLAKDLIRFLCQEPQASTMMITMNGLRMPVWKKLLTLDMWKDRSLKPLADAMPNTVMQGYPGPVTDVALEAFKQGIVSKMTLRVLTDGWTADRAIAEAVQKLQAVKDSMKK